MLTVIISRSGTANDSDRAVPGPRSIAPIAITVSLRSRDKKPATFGAGIRRRSYERAQNTAFSVNFTSGLLVAAKNDETHRALAAQLSGHHIRREYRAIAVGSFAEDTGTVDLPIGRHPTDRKRMAVTDRGHTRCAVTHYRVLERFPGFSYLSLELETGRTHQIRVHMSHLGHPLIGDTVYGGGHTPFEKKHASLLSGQCLHAVSLTFTHPKTGKEVTFTCPLPDDFEKLLAILRTLAN